ncbi:hypothetical protein DFQ28_005687 [Apophysomyces sp. BC1034]|nr:hypothetical protein DFQ30_006303 [Apophysomyces sp. BC1015]KAG0177035.1 hypothetical protein DFQ29_005318 [Apophysomyces sp. BC1021]KAG0187915.1 hypothetical protein DFQ28_005687 [Apophysomyces sp. BC1034]
MSTRKHRYESGEEEDRDSKHHRKSHHKEKKRKREREEEETRGISQSLKDQIQPISDDDYFEKATEFRLWLKDAKHKYFNELDSNDSRRYFKKFVKAWNRFELEEKYYKGLNPAQLSSSDTTRYKWAFAKKLDQHELDTIRDSVDTLTSRTGSGPSVGVENRGRRRNVGPAMPSSSSKPFDQGDMEDRADRDKAIRKGEARGRRQRRDEYLDEVAPKETGREAMIAKRRATNAFHKRERSPDVELPEEDLMGGDDFQARLAAEKRNEERRKARRSEYQQQRFAPLQDKMAQYKAKENATIEMFKKMAEEQKRLREGQ